MRYIIGLFFIIIGVLFVFQGFNLDLILRMGINFSKFWPFLLIIIGISILSKEIKWLKIINIFLLFGFLLSLIFWDYNNNVFIFKEYKDYEKMEFEILPDSNNLDLYFDLSTLNIEISTDSESDKISGYYYGPMILNIDKKGNSIFFKNEKIFGTDYKMFIKIPEKYLYNFYLECGVVNIELNNIKNVIKILSIDSGVININGKIKSFDKNMYLDMDGGVSKIKLIVPKKTTYSLNYDGGIKSINISKNLIEDIDGNLRGNIEAGVLNIKLETEE
ncbi:hypothetical protein [Marinitoga sp. 38H-ov]|uniref:hypothetical protein n=1 Tax=Marinitoga sp. 38H-ov TaxID=1755814 RepID=UPI0013E9A931|nr:hypothetical protein [Marinitoga sp. 38H-ov]KAF2956961.1 hypothetical protein AS160_02955 [Marinitoga sp. 38H-ov]